VIFVQGERQYSHINEKELSTGKKFTIDQNIGSFSKSQAKKDQREND